MSLETFNIELCALCIESSLSPRAHIYANSGGLNFHVGTKKSSQFIILPYFCNTDASALKHNIISSDCDCRQ
jgi:hypothetical protein